MFATKSKADLFRRYPSFYMIYDDTFNLRIGRCEVVQLVIIPQLLLLIPISNRIGEIRRNEEYWYW
jgi:hypothetical protein